MGYLARVIDEKLCFSVVASQNGSTLEIAFLEKSLFASFVQAAVLMFTNNPAQVIIILSYAIANCGLIVSLW